MTSKYHNPTLRINPRHREEEPQNTYSHTSAGRQLEKNNSPQQEVAKL